MADPFVAEIHIFPYNFAPKNWADCDGQLLVLAQNTALFSLLGTMYGGDGRSTFALPDLRGAGTVGQGTGVSNDFFQGEMGGETAVTLVPTEMPQHNHAALATSSPGNVNSPNPNMALARTRGGTAYQSSANLALVPMGFQTIAPAGSSLPHNNMMPFLTLRFCIALAGIFPPRA
jgi:microcystin-dependent protein